MPSPRKNDGLAGEGTRPPPIDDAATGLPGLRSWRAVYICVLCLFVVWVGLLTVLTEMYS